MVMFVTMRHELPACLKIRVLQPPLPHHSWFTK
jgi:hypothetical protein